MSSSLTHFNEDLHLFFEEYNTIEKCYKNGMSLLKKYSYSSCKGLTRENRHTGTMTKSEKDLKNKKYLKKVKSNIIDLAFNYSNWEYFITLTFDFSKEEYTHEKAIEKLSKWLDNQKHQNKDMIYLLVPEFHKKGHLHFHGLIANVPKWNFEAAKYPTGRLIKKNGLQIYNLLNYKLGFTTISRIQDQEKVSNYISKYATKDLITLKSKKRYWYSRNLEKPSFNYHYLVADLKDSFRKDKILYCNEFVKENSSIEVLKLKGNITYIIGSRTK